MIHEAEILSQRRLAPDIYRLELFAPRVAEQAQPGQFLMVRTSISLDPFLRRPLSVNAVDRRRGAVALLYRVVGRGTRLLAERKLGKRLNVVGPLGRGFTVPLSGPVVLVAGGLGIAPLFFLAEVCRQRGNEVILFYGARSQEELVLRRELESLGIKVFWATDDGSLGERGTVVELLKKKGLPPAAPVYAAGPPPMLKALAAALKDMGREAEFSLEERMGCGVGACRGCAVKVREGKDFVYRRVCADGPVFKAGEVVWE
ncbi:dihydroorotate dehydrogenase electron transfer subunit [Ammonifex thiophilus]|uniref:Dihydroorotate dehydrogenase B (NAD(+)), electron transfer subunit n=1 Tax=Ammonifex thiophilus TaxID=444093 RepID=A0A3D8P3T3_9THEO|nr:dihydroorotate dehydrogenase electron transfer subunit [Ammonifex thiophilus]RDV81679.1 dihydroorotate dehydrogenase electron transfer subunit [Ammonifex thiophilus]